MSKKELEEKLNKIGINKDFYSFGGVYTDGTLVLDESINYYSNDKQYKEWRVFLHERGIRYDEKIFYNEEAALDDMYERLKKYKIPGKK